MRGEPGQLTLIGSATPRDDRTPMHSSVERIARVRMETTSLAELGISTGGVSLGSLLAGDTGVSGIGRIKGLPMSPILYVVEGGRRRLASRRAKQWKSLQPMLMVCVKRTCRASTASAATQERSGPF